MLQQCLEGYFKQVGSYMPPPLMFFHPPYCSLSIRFCSNKCQLDQLETFFLIQYCVAHIIDRLNCVSESMCCENSFNDAYIYIHFLEVQKKYYSEYIILYNKKKIFLPSNINNLKCSVGFCFEIELYINITHAQFFSAVVSDR